VVVAPDRLEVAAGMALDTLEKFVLPEVVPVPLCFNDFVPSMGVVVEAVHSPFTPAVQAFTLSKSSNICPNVNVEINTVQMKEIN
jgi:hypothetical protein